MAIRNGTRSAEQMASFTTFLSGTAGYLPVKLILSALPVAEANGGTRMIANAFARTISKYGLSHLDLLVYTLIPTRYPAILKNDNDT